jgi:hypothetical protein
MALADIIAATVATSDAMRVLQQLQERKATLQADLTTVIDAITAQQQIVINAKALLKSLL